MSYSVASLKRISPRALAEKILGEKDLAEPSFAIIDVRDSDYIGGHIKGSTNVPSVNLDVMMPTLVRKLQDKKAVVFHCALSQQRGPYAALKYLRQRDSLLEKLVANSTINSTNSTNSTTQEGNASTTTWKKEDQEVLLLDQGFVAWQREFGADKRLTEGYVKELWENY